jgi:hypothetical protein
MAKISKDLSAGNLHPRETIFLAGTIAAVNSELPIPCDGSSTVSLDLRGTFNLTIEVSGTVDGVQWTPIPVRPVNTASISYVPTIVGTVQGVWMGSCAGYRQVRARCTASTSGSAFAVISASTAPLDQSLLGMVTPLLVSQTGAASAALTATLPAPGAGLRQYLTYLRILRSASAALTAGAAPTVVTTTNLPGTLAFSFGADAAPQGTDKVIQEDFAYPLAALAQNTATTIVCPATTGVIWRVTCGYYVAP